ncbi:hypothetical protein [Singulisphaera sp. PoT]|uniref:hypothetical protein n=1 Tax=Singulisphaera sp. PoT TaxID=3411797 RepID=UPI003BF4B991
MTPSGHLPNGPGLHDLLADDDLEALCLAIAREPESFDRPGESGVPPLYTAAWHRNARAVELLPEHGATLDIFACDNPAREREAESLVAQTPGLVRATTANGLTPLHLAARAGHLDAAEVILRHGCTLSAEERRRILRINNDQGLLDELLSVEPNKSLAVMLRQVFMWRQHRLGQPRHPLLARPPRGPSEGLDPRVEPEDLCGRGRLRPGPSAAPRGFPSPSAPSSRLPFGSTSSDPGLSLRPEGSGFAPARGLGSSAPPNPQKERKRKLRKSPTNKSKGKKELSMRGLNPRRGLPLRHIGVFLPDARSLLLPARRPAGAGASPSPPRRDEVGPSLIHQARRPPSCLRRQGPATPFA